MDDSECQWHTLDVIDPEVATAIENETQRQSRNLNLIASENYSSEALREALGSVLTDKYAEGYPGARWYGGCQHADEVERLAIERACKLFGAEHANVQPHSGSQANMAAYLALIEPGDTILSMSLAHGGHLTHGHSKSATGKLFRVIHYGVRAGDCLIDYESVSRLAREHKPNLIIAGSSSYSREIDFARFGEIARDVGACLVSDMAHIAGLVAAGLHCDPVPSSHVVTSTTHKTLRGPRGGFVLCGKEFASRVDAAIFPGIQGGPMIHVIAAKAVAFKEALSPEFKEYQRLTVANARALAEQLTRLGFKVVSGGTDTHMFLVDLTDGNMTGKRAEELLGMANITANKNAVPFDPHNPAEAGGIRFGTAALSSRGMKETEMKVAAGWIARILSASEPDQEALRLRPEVIQMCESFPLRHF